MTITRAQLQSVVIPGLHAVVGTSYGQVPDELGPMFDTLTSNRSFEEETMMSMFGEAPIKSEGASVEYDDAQELWKSRYDNRTIALAFAMTEEAMEDDLYEVTGRLKANGLGRSMASTKQQIGADVYNNAFNASYTGGDGVSLINDSHPLANGGTLDNKATADLSETALEDAIIAIENFVDDRGILVNVMAKNLIVPSELQFDAYKILNSDLSTVNATAGTDGITNTNELNALNRMGMFPDGIHVNRRLTDTDAWFIRTDCPQGLQHFQRKAMTLGEEGDFDTGNLRFKARERYSFGWTDFRGIYGSDGSAS